ncbi:interleukin-17A-like [Hyperolius riggenbachi]|uniref:interleukin-17A-like n=1 Tax=Hyperolius riggenbachi TaxID=752182 RepID=UPI0035A35D99
MHLPSITLAFLVAASMLLTVSGRILPFPRGTDSPSSVQISLNMTRIDQISHTMHESLARRSLSPWTYRTDQDLNRYPSNISVAECSHQWCLDAEGKEVSSLISVPIRYEMMVLRREIHPNQSFYLETQLVTVGCTCVRPNIRPL